MKDSTTSQEDDESEDEGLEEVLSGAHNLEQVTLILSLYVMVFLPTSLHVFLDTLNPLSPNADQDHISPNNIHTLSGDKL